MTIPKERYNSLMATRRFLVSLLYPELTPKVPKKIRMEARARLKHFPCNIEIRDMEQRECFSLGQQYRSLYRDYEKNPLNPELEGF